MNTEDILMEKYLDTIFGELQKNNSVATGNIVSAYKELKLPKEASFFQVELRRLANAVSIELQDIIKDNNEDVVVSEEFIFDYLQTMYENLLADNKSSNSSSMHSRLFLDKSADKIISILLTNSKFVGESYFNRFINLDLPEPSTYRDHLLKIGTKAFRATAVKLIKELKLHVNISEEDICNYLDDLYEARLSIHKSTTDRINDATSNPKQTIRYTPADLEMIKGLWVVVNNLLDVNDFDKDAYNLLGSVNYLRSRSNSINVIIETQLLTYFITSGYTLECTTQQCNSSLTELYNKLKELNELKGNNGKEEILKTIPSDILGFTDWIIQHS